MGTLEVPPELRERFDLRWSPEPNSGCWVWMGAIDRGGYGRFDVKRQSREAHRVSYVLYVGPIPEGFEIDHLCRCRWCVNPAHLEAVPPAVNNRRAHEHRFGAWDPNRCKNGHRLPAPVTVGTRVCRACWRESSRRYLSRKRAAGASA